MKRGLTILLIIALLLAALASGLAEPADDAEDNKTAVDKLSFGGLLISPDTEILDFDASGTTVTDAKALAEILDQLPNLKEVRLFDSPMATEDMGWLFDRYYPQVFFGFTIQIGQHIIRTDQTAFSTLHHSGETKEDKRHTSEELYPLRMCTRMKALDLGHNYLTDLNFLYWMPDIEVLIISPNYGLKDITPVGTLKNLVYLECFNTPITDLTPLAGLTKLRDLNLTLDGYIRDISPLYDLPNLERVWWGGLLCTTAQRQTMREKHKGCRFVSVKDPTSGGWRSGSHFKELYAFFRTGEYVPFSE